MALLGERDCFHGHDDAWLRAARCEPVAPRWRSRYRQRIVALHLLAGHLAVPEMSNFSRRLGLALLSAALCLGAPTAHAQDAPVRYWIPGGPFGFGDDLAAGVSLDTYGNFPSFEGGGVRDGGFPYMRFPKGWFVGSEGGAVDPDWAFGGIGSLRYEGVQFGYNFKSLGGLPVTFYGGVDNLKYDAGIGAPFASFDATSGTLPGYSAHAGVALQATPNVSLSLGVGYTQLQSGRVDSDINSPLLPGASPFALVGH